MPGHWVVGYESVELTELRLAFKVSWVIEEAAPCDRRRAEMEAVSSCCFVCLCINLVDVSDGKVERWTGRTDFAYSDMALSE
jgi:hypothetical protein